MDAKGEIHAAAVRALRHDARNLLSGVAIMADHFESAGDAKGQQFADYLRDKVQAMIRAAERADLLAGIEEKGVEPLDPVPFIHAAAEAQGAEDAKLSVEVTGEPLRFDPELFELALTEILSNALATGTIVSVRREGSDLLIADQGRGIPEPAREKLFEPFRGAKRPGGTSLGLPLALAAMKAQGGDLSYESSEDGTTVRLGFPG